MATIETDEHSEVVDVDWQEVCNNPLFKDDPFKVETNRWGHIEMTPASNEHGLFQACIIAWLAKLGTLGHALGKCSILTSQGVKVGDVAWGTAEFFRTNGRANPYRQNPEIVIEILSPSNSAAEMEEKRTLFLPWRRGILDVRQRRKHALFQ